MHYTEVELVVSSRQQFGPSAWPRSRSVLSTAMSEIAFNQGTDVQPCGKSPHWLHSASAWLALDDFVWLRMWLGLYSGQYERTCLASSGSRSSCTRGVNTTELFQSWLIIKCSKNEWRGSFSFHVLHVWGYDCVHMWVRCIIEMLLFVSAMFVS